MSSQKRKGRKHNFSTASSTSLIKTQPAKTSTERMRELRERRRELVEEQGVLTSKQPAKKSTECLREPKDRQRQSKKEQGASASKQPAKTSAQCVAVACKSCPGCKHSFQNAKRLLSQSIRYTDSLTIVSRRRTERIKREKPNYYDSSEYEKKISKKRLERSRYDNTERCRPSLQSLKKKKKKKLNKPIKEEDEETAFVLPNEKLKQCSIILAELNRKMATITWRR